VKSIYHSVGGDAERLLTRGLVLPLVSGGRGTLAWGSPFVREKTVRELWTKKGFTRVALELF